MWLTAVSVGWSGVIGSAAIWLAGATGSVAVLAFGADAVIDAAASVALIWRFRVEHTDPARATRVERLAQRIVGAVLVVAAAIVSAFAVRSLLLGSRVEASTPVLLMLGASIVVLPPLAIAKRTTATALSSRALRADSFLTAAAAVLAAVSLAGVVASTTLGVAAADPLGALVIAAAIAVEGWRSATHEEGTPPVER